MYVLVQHTISQPACVLQTQPTRGQSPREHLTLHHTFPTPDGTRAVCIWEAASIDAVRVVVVVALKG